MESTPTTLDPEFKKRQWPYPSWSFDPVTNTWTMPVAYPNDGLVYEWDEDLVNWVLWVKPAKTAPGPI